MKIGIVGCGNISGIYLSNAKSFPELEIAACGDINMAAAEAKAAEHGVKAMSPDEILADPSIGLILNLTIPKAHFSIGMRAIEAGKHVYSEKPLTLNAEEARTMLAAAKKKGLRVGSAPDTILGAGQQTSRKLIDDKWIGKPLSGSVAMLSSGPESWHPSPFSFYQKGAGPMMDMGPYYLCSLVNLLGPVKSVSAYVGKASEKRIATSKEQFGRTIDVEVPTHYSGTMEFHSGVLVNLTMSFDVKRHSQNPIEIYGSEGSLLVPDPNSFGGPVKVFRSGNESWSESALSHRYSKNFRILGVADMIAAIREKRAHRCSGELALHLIETMSAFEKSSESGTRIQIESKPDRPEAMRADLPEGIL